MKELLFEPVNRQEWYHQRRNNMKSSRMIDKMSIEEVFDMFKQRKFCCDICGRGLDRNNFTLEDHVNHLINPIIFWSCDECSSSN